MIVLLYTTYERPLPNDSFDQYLEQLPQSLVSQIRSYRKWEDQHNSLFGKILLKRGLEMIGYPTCLLGTIRYNYFKRPFLEGNIDFNVSHSGKRIGVVISDSHRVGIDLENILPVDIMDFKSCWSGKEWHKIIRSENLYHTFYSMWTRKEAIVKAEGIGLNIPLRSVNVLKDAVLINNNCWHLKSLDLFDNCAIHIALDTDVDTSEIVVASTTL
jgi:4'-phosphopantetheinyl transferase